MQEPLLFPEQQQNPQFPKKPLSLLQDVGFGVWLCFSCALLLPVYCFLPQPAQRHRQFLLALALVFTVITFHTECSKQS